MTTLTHWTRVPLSTEGWDIGPTDPERVTFLREYRENGSMHGAWMCSADALARMSDDDAPDAGPKVDQIDWTGFPS